MFDLIKTGVVLGFSMMAGMSAFEYLRDKALEAKENQRASNSVEPIMVNIKTDESKKEPYDFE